MSHNDNYLRIILWQWLRHYRPAGEGTGEGACLALPEKKITRYKSDYLHHVRTQCAIWCIHAPMSLPSKISTAVKTTCERIVPSKFPGHRL